VFPNFSQYGLAPTAVSNWVRLGKAPAPQPVEAIASRDHSPRLEMKNEFRECPRIVSLDAYRAMKGMQRPEEDGNKERSQRMDWQSQVFPAQHRGMRQVPATATK